MERNLDQENKHPIAQQLHIGIQRHVQFLGGPRGGYEPLGSGEHVRLDILKPSPGKNGEKRDPNNNPGNKQGLNDSINQLSTPSWLRWLRLSPPDPGHKISPKDNHNASPFSVFKRNDAELSRSKRHHEAP